MNKPVYLGLSMVRYKCKILISKILMYGFWYDYVKTKYDENVKLCHIYTDSFIFHVKTDDIYKDIAEYVETRFNTSNFESGRPLPK